MKKLTLTERVNELEQQVRDLQLAKIVDPPWQPAYPIYPIAPWPSFPSWPYYPVITSNRTHSYIDKILVGSKVDAAAAVLS